jgi:anti-anti-sigma factor
MAPAEPPSAPAARVIDVARAGIVVNGGVVWLHGEHDIANVAPLREVLGGAAAAAEADVVVDLADVEFISATTVGALAHARGLLREHSRDLVLRAPSACARRVLDVCEVPYVPG